MLPHPKQTMGAGAGPRLPSGCPRAPTTYAGRSSHLFPVLSRPYSRRPAAVHQEGGPGDRQRAGEVGKEEGKRLAFIKSRKFIS